jgi:hypothetical protein
MSAGTSSRRIISRVFVLADVAQRRRSLAHLSRHGFPLLHGLQHGLSRAADDLAG